VSRSDKHVERDQTAARQAESSPATDYSRLPDPIETDETIASHEPTPAPDPDGGRDPERDFMLRYAG
jgi:hypothetical protein